MHLRALNALKLHTPRSLPYRSSQPWGHATNAGSHSTACELHTSRQISHPKANENQPEKHRTQGQDLPGFSMKDLGASRAVKVAVYTVIGIIATLETMTWCTWGWSYLYPPAERGEDEGVLLADKDQGRGA